MTSKIVDEQTFPTDLDSIFYGHADAINITTTYVLSMDTQYLEGIYTLKGKPKWSQLQNFCVKQLLFEILSPFYYRLYRCM